MTTTDPLELRLRAAARTPTSDPPPLARAALEAGLLDVAYAQLDSPLGRLLLAGTPEGLVQLAYVDSAAERDAVLERLAARLSPRVLDAPARLDLPRRQLDEYFAGRRRRFDLRIDWRLVGSFGRRVLAATAAVPYGGTATYREIAASAGSPQGSRAAGNALGSNPMPIVIPCHRVLRSGGGLGGYTGGLDRKRTLLALELGQAPLPAGP